MSPRHYEDIACDNLCVHRERERERERERKRENMGFWGEN